MDCGRLSLEDWDWWGGRGKNEEVLKQGGENRNGDVGLNWIQNEGTSGVTQVSGNLLACAPKGDVLSGGLHCVC